VSTGRRCGRAWHRARFERVDKRTCTDIADALALPGALPADGLLDLVKCCDLAERLAARIENRRTRLVGEQLRRAFQDLEQSGLDRREKPCCAADPVSKCRAIKLDALTSINLCLAIKRTVIGIFADQHMRYEAFSRDAAFNQAGWR